MEVVARAHGLSAHAERQRDVAAAQALGAGRQYQRALAMQVAMRIPHTTPATQQR
jgi:hypothetical protein